MRRQIRLCLKFLCFSTATEVKLWEDKFDCVWSFCVSQQQLKWSYEKTNSIVFEVSVFLNSNWSEAMRRQIRLCLKFLCFSTATEVKLWEDKFDCVWSFCVSQQQLKWSYEKTNSIVFEVSVFLNSNWSEAMRRQIRLCLKFLCFSTATEVKLWEDKFDCVWSFCVSQQQLKWSYEKTNSIVFEVSVFLNSNWSEAMRRQIRLCLKFLCFSTATEVKLWEDKFDCVWSFCVSQQQLKWSYEKTNSIVFEVSVFLNSNWSEAMRRQIRLCLKFLCFSTATEVKLWEDKFDCVWSFCVSQQQLKWSYEKTNLIVFEVSVFLNSNWSEAMRRQIRLCLKFLCFSTATEVKLWEDKFDCVWSFCVSQQQLKWSYEKTNSIVFEVSVFLNSNWSEAMRRQIRLCLKFLCFSTATEVKLWEDKFDCVWSFCVSQQQLKWSYEKTNSIVFEVSVFLNSNWSEAMRRQIRLCLKFLCFSTATEVKLWEDKFDCVWSFCVSQQQLKWSYEKTNSIVFEVSVFLNSNWSEAMRRQIRLCLKFLCFSTATEVKLWEDKFDCVWSFCVSQQQLKWSYEKTNSIVFEVSVFLNSNWSEAMRRQIRLCLKFLCFSTATEVKLWEDKFDCVWSFCVSQQQLKWSYEKTNSIVFEVSVFLNSNWSEAMRKQIRLCLKFLCFSTATEVKLWEDKFDCVWSFCVSQQQLKWSYEKTNSIVFEVSVFLNSNWSEAMRNQIRLCLKFLCFSTATEVKLWEDKFDCVWSFCVSQQQLKWSYEKTNSIVFEVFVFLNSNWSEAMRRQIRLCLKFLCFSTATEVKLWEDKFDCVWSFCVSQQQLKWSYEKTNSIVFEVSVFLNSNWSEAMRRQIRLCLKFLCFSTATEVKLWENKFDCVWSFCVSQQQLKWSYEKTNSIVFEVSVFLNSNWSEAMRRQIRLCLKFLCFSTATEVKLWEDKFDCVWSFCVSQQQLKWSYEKTNSIVFEVSVFLNSNWSEAMRRQIRLCLKFLCFSTATEVKLWENKFDCVWSFCVSQQQLKWSYEKTNSIVFEVSVFLNSNWSEAMRRQIRLCLKFLCFSTATEVKLWENKFDCVWSFCVSQQQLKWSYEKTNSIVFEVSVFLNSNWSEAMRRQIRLCLKFLCFSTATEVKLWEDKFDCVWSFSNTETVSVFLNSNWSEAMRRQIRLCLKFLKHRNCFCVSQQQLKWSYEKTNSIVFEVSVFLNSNWSEAMRRQIRLCLKFLCFSTATEVKLWENKFDCVWSFCVSQQQLKWSYEKTNSIVFEVSVFLNSNWSDAMRRQIRLCLKFLCFSTATEVKLWEDKFDCVWSFSNTETVSVFLNSNWSEAMRRQIRLCLKFLKHRNCFCVSQQQLKWSYEKTNSIVFEVSQTQKLFLCFSTATEVKLWEDKFDYVWSFCVSQQQLKWSYEKTNSIVFEVSVFLNSNWSEAMRRQIRLCLKFLKHGNCFWVSQQQLKWSYEKTNSIVFDVSQTQKLFLCFSTATEVKLWEDKFDCVWSFCVSQQQLKWSYEKTNSIVFEVSEFLNSNWSEAMRKQIRLCLKFLCFSTATEVKLWENKFDCVWSFCVSQQQLKWSYEKTNSIVFEVSVFLNSNWSEAMRRQIRLCLKFLKHRNCFCVSQQQLNWSYEKTNSIVFEVSQTQNLFLCFSTATEVKLWEDKFDCVWSFSNTETVSVFLNSNWSEAMRRQIRLCLKFLCFSTATEVKLWEDKFDCVWSFSNTETVSVFLNSNWSEAMRRQIRLCLKFLKHRNCFCVSQQQLKWSYEKTNSIVFEVSVFLNSNWSEAMRRQIRLCLKFLKHRNCFCVSQQQLKWSYEKTNSIVFEVSVFLNSNWSEAMRRQIRLCLKFLCFLTATEVILWENKFDCVWGFCVSQQQLKWSYEKTNSIVFEVSAFLNSNWSEAMKKQIRLCLKFLCFSTATEVKLWEDKFDCVWSFCVSQQQLKWSYEKTNSIVFEVSVFLNSNWSEAMRRQIRLCLKFLKHRNCFCVSQQQLKWSYEKTNSIVFEVSVFLNSNWSEAMRRQIRLCLKFLCFSTATEVKLWEDKFDCVWSFSNTETVSVFLNSNWSEAMRRQIRLCLKFLKHRNCFCVSQQQLKWSYEKTNSIVFEVSVFLNSNWSEAMRRQIRLCLKFLCFSTATEVKLWENKFDCVWSFCVSQQQLKWSYEKTNSIVFEVSVFLNSNWSDAMRRQIRLCLKFLCFSTATEVKLWEDKFDCVWSFSNTETVSVFLNSNWSEAMRRQIRLCLRFLKHRNCFCVSQQQLKWSYEKTNSIVFEVSQTQKLFLCFSTATEVKLWEDKFDYVWSFCVSQQQLKWSYEKTNSIVFEVSVFLNSNWSEAMRRQIRLCLKFLKHRNCFWVSQQQLKWSYEKTNSIVFDVSQTQKLFLCFSTATEVKLWEDKFDCVWSFCVSQQQLKWSYEKTNSIVFEVSEFLNSNWSEAMRKQIRLCLKFLCFSTATEVKLWENKFDCVWSFCVSQQQLKWSYEKTNSIVFEVSVFLNSNWSEAMRRQIRLCLKFLKHRNCFCVSQQQLNWSYEKTNSIVFEVSQTQKLFLCFSTATEVKLWEDKFDCVWSFSNTETVSVFLNSNWSEAMRRQIRLCLKFLCFSTATEVKLWEDKFDCVWSFSNTETVSVFLNSNWSEAMRRQIRLCLKFLKHRNCFCVSQQQLKWSYEKTNSIVFEVSVFLNSNWSEAMRRQIRLCLKFLKHRNCFCVSQQQLKWSYEKTNSIVFEVSVFLNSNWSEAMRRQIRLCLKFLCFSTATEVILWENKFDCVWGFCVSQQQLKWSYEKTNSIVFEVSAFLNSNWSEAMKKQIRLCLKFLCFSTATEVKLWEDKFDCVWSFCVSQQQLKWSYEKTNSIVFEVSVFLNSNWSEVMRRQIRLCLKFLCFSTATEVKLWEDKFDCVWSFCVSQQQLKWSYEKTNSIVFEVSVFLNSNWSEAMRKQIRLCLKFLCFSTATEVKLWEDKFDCVWSFCVSQQQLKWSYEKTNSILFEVSVFLNSNWSEAMRKQIRLCLKFLCFSTATEVKLWEDKFDCVWSFCVSQQQLKWSYEKTNSIVFEVSVFLNSNWSEAMRRQIRLCLKFLCFSTATEVNLWENKFDCVWGFCVSQQQLKWSYEKTNSIVFEVSVFLNSNWSEAMRKQIRLCLKFLRFSTATEVKLWENKFDCVWSFCVSQQQLKSEVMLRKTNSIVFEVFVFLNSNWSEAMKKQIRLCLKFLCFSTATEVKLRKNKFDCVWSFCVSQQQLKWSYEKQIRLCLKFLCFSNATEVKLWKNKFDCVWSFCVSQQQLKWSYEKTNSIVFEVFVFLNSNWSEAMRKQIRLCLKFLCFSTATEVKLWENKFDCVWSFCVSQQQLKWSYEKTNSIVFEVSAFLNSNWSEAMRRQIRLCLKFLCFSTATEVKLWEDKFDCVWSFCVSQQQLKWSYEKTNSIVFEVFVFLNSNWSEAMRKQIRLCLKFLCFSTATEVELWENKFDCVWSFCVSQQQLKWSYEKTNSIVFEVSAFLNSNWSEAMRRQIRLCLKFLCFSTATEVKLWEDKFDCVWSFCVSQQQLKWSYEKTNSIVFEVSVFLNSNWSEAMKKQIRLCLKFLCFS